jgi:lysophospholipase L1-like esterase
MNKILSAALLLVGVSIFGPFARAELFQDGETVCFLGDSITARGSLQTNVSDFYLTRFPERTVQFVNAGRSGDTAKGSLRRLKEDVIDHAPTSVVIMFGMNDVGRGYYTFNPTGAQIQSQKSALERFQASMEEVVARIRTEAGEPKLIFLTPTPYDQTAEMETKNLFGCNDGLGRCGEIVRKLAAANPARVVDLHGPMTELNGKQQESDPKWTIVGPDRVHPGAPGFLMMTYLFLKEQGAPAIVSQVAVDAATGEVNESINAAVTAVKSRDGGVTFKVLAKALPYPIDSAAKEMLDLLPIEADLNQELLSVTGLAEGTYELRIDGTAVGQHPAKELADGINLAFNEATPQFKQAGEVARHNARRKSAEAEAASLLNSRRWMIYHYKIDVEDPAAVQAHYEHFEDKKEYSAVMARRYIEKWPQYGEIRKQVDIHWQAALASRQPVEHLYEVVPVKASAR